MEEAFTIKQIKKLYNIEVNSTYFIDWVNDGIIIKVYLDFIPKEETTMTPVEATSYAKYFYNFEKKKTSFEDMTYLRKDEIPILSYTQQEYYLDNFCEELAEKEYQRLLNVVLTSMKSN